MSYRYLALIGATRQRGDSIDNELSVAILEHGLQKRRVSGALTLFVSADTPTVPLPGGGLVIGHLFSREGIPIKDEARFQSRPFPRQIRDDILKHCWGDYLLVLPASEGECGFTVLRSPSLSSELACLYTFRDEGGFITSDISLAQRLGLYRSRIDWEFIAQRLTFPDLKTSRTGLMGVHELLPGSMLHLDGDTMTTEQAWSPWDFVAKERRHFDPQQAATEVRDVTERVIGAWAVADESILLELSGGLDSSIIGACLRRTHARVVCCTVTTSDPGGDERRYADLIAESLGATLFEQCLRVENARFDFPVPPSYATPRIGPLQWAVDELIDIEGCRHEVASYFSGGGGDSVFGYLRTAAPAADALREHGLRAAMDSIRDLCELHQCTFWKAARLTLWKLMRAPKAPCTTVRSFLAPAKVATIPEFHPWHQAPAGALPGDRERIFDLAITQIYRESTPRGTTRRMRMPLLSQPIVEACLKVPCWMWIANGRNRSLARAAFEDMLPQEIVNRRSKGTFINYLGAVYQRNKLQICDFLLNGQLQAHGYLDVDALKRFVGSPLPPRDRTFTRLLDLCMIENWLRQQSQS